MAHGDLRDYLAVLEQRGLLRRVRDEVDPEWEIGCLVKWGFQALPDADRFGFLFDKVKGSAFPVATGAIGASVEAYATALGVEADQINAKWEDALLNTVAPNAVDTGACQDVVLEGEKADLGILPIPVWTPGKDAGRYVTAIVATRHAETGIHNYGVYRTQVLGKDRMVSNLSPGRQGGQCVLSHHARGEPAPIAFLIGAPPAVYYAAVTNLPLGADEMEIAGGLHQAPIDLVKAKTVDLMIPAQTEIVIEGLVYPDEMAPEGPFGEFAGYMGPVDDRPVVHVTAITHRREPIFYGLASQIPPSESTIIQSLTNAGQLLKFLRHDRGYENVVDAFVDLTFGGLLAHVIVATRPGKPGEAKEIGELVADVSLFKRVTMVDDDVDIRDPVHMDWALNSHYDPIRDTTLIGDVFVPVHMDPSVRVEDGSGGTGSKIVVDATRTIDAGDLSLPSREIMEKARETWRKAGLPEFDIPKRLDLRLDRS